MCDTIIKSWDELDDKQRKKVIVWFEEHLDELFGEKLCYGNEYNKPPVPKGKRLSTKRKFEWNGFEFSTFNSMLKELYYIMKLDGVVRYDIPFIEKIETRQPVFLGLDPYYICHSQEDMEKKDNEMLNSSLWKSGFDTLFRIGVTKEQLLQSANKNRDKEWEDKRYEYVISLEVDGKKSMSNNGYLKFEHALEVIRPRMIVRIPSRKYQDMIKSKDWDWSKQGLIEVPKIEIAEEIASSNYLRYIKDTSLYDKVVNNVQNDEFIEFAKSL